ncbi:uncharacterized protein LOC101845563 [Aplysia californica]|uniref:Uncharacterized protein LOC101845563 n=1 Tax=Aplysia californica TaxID=6500 RepID=A0ABM0JWK8_APLCA|nr:uncharacterized protein LOC101845563 [Aplysia californica]
MATKHPRFQVRLLQAGSNLLELIFVYCLLQMILLGVVVYSDDNEHAHGYLLCRKCGYELAEAEDLISVPSTLAHRQRNDSMGGGERALIQLFKNPQGAYFEVITLTNAHVEKANEKYAADSWFPGFAWSIASCPKCGVHIGWGFDAITNSVQEMKIKLSSFVGLIMDKVMHEDEVYNLIAVPKVYTS